MIQKLPRSLLSEFNFITLSVVIADSHALNQASHKVRVHPHA